MRAHEFIVEYKQDVTIRYYGEKLKQRLVMDSQAGADSMYDMMYRAKTTTNEKLKQEFTDIANNMLIHYIIRFEDSDPTKNKQYTEWLIRFYTNNSEVSITSLPKFRDFLYEYHKLKAKNVVPNDMRDINKLQNMHDFVRYQKAISALFDEHDDTEQKMDKGRYKVLLDNNELQIIHILDKTAACYFGRSGRKKTITNWCTAAFDDGDNKYEDYKSRGELYVFLPKEEEMRHEKYQMHVDEDTGSTELNDKDNDSFSFDDLLERFPSLNKKMLFKMNPKLKLNPKLNSELAEKLLDKLADTMEEYFDEKLDMMKSDDEPASEIRSVKIQMSLALDAIRNYDLRDSMDDLNSIPTDIALDLSKLYDWFYDSDYNYMSDLEIVVDDDTDEVIIRG